MEKNVLAIVVTYNRSHLLAGCLNALLAQTVPCQVLVVDNASTDETPQVIAPFLSEKLRVLRLDTNTGGAGGFRAGMEAGVLEGYRYLWIMDDDAYPEPTALEELLRAAQTLNGDFGFLASAVLWTDGKECRMNRPKAKKNFFEQLDLLQHGILAIEQATFVSCLFQADTVRQMGLPIQEFFIWGDDIEYTRRLAVRNRLPSYLVGKSIVIHHMTQNTGSDISRDDCRKLSRYAYAYRNENYLYRKEGLSGVLYYIARCGLHLVRIWTKARDHRLKRSWVLIRSAVGGCFFRPTVRYPE